MTITKEEAIAKYGKDNVWSFGKSEWAYRDAKKWVHLMRFIDGKWIELTKGIKAREVWSYDWDRKKSDWGYEDQNRERHKIKWDGSKY
jgi:hypothetical protein